MADVVRGVAFGCSVAVTALLCPKDFKRVKYQPPNWVFGVVWPLLYVTTGVAWAISERDDLFTLLTLLSCAWLVLYQLLKWTEAALVDLVVATAVAAAASAVLPPPEKWLLLPLAAWLAFASFLNGVEVYSSR